MFDALTSRLARRSALKQVKRRVVQPWALGPGRRHALVVLPTGDEAAREAWRFVKSLGLDPDQLTPVVLSGEVTFVPAEYIGRILRLESDQINMFGLPRPAFVEKVWARSPDIALCLSPTFDIASALLVGASPAPFRVGFHGDDAEPFFDLMVSPSQPLAGDAIASAFAAMRETIARVDPPVLTLPV